MSKPRPLKTGVCSAELDRLRFLPGFPEVPSAREELIRQVRQITRDEGFLHALITHFVNRAGWCPAIRELNEQARIMRAIDHKRGDPACPQCGGSGWTLGRKLVKVAGMEPYEAEFSERCRCALGVAS